MCQFLAEFVRYVFGVFSKWGVIVHMLHRSFMKTQKYEPSMNVMNNQTLFSKSSKSYGAVSALMKREIVT